MKVLWVIEAIDLITRESIENTILGDNLVDVLIKADELFRDHDEIEFWPVRLEVENADSH